MGKHEVRRDLAIRALASLTEARIPHAVQRNVDEIAAGTYKDIDLIAPSGSVAPIREAFLAQNDVAGTLLTRAFSRSSISVVLSCAQAQRVVIDIDHQITLAGDVPICGRIGRLVSRSVVFSDLTTRQLAFDGAKITVLDPTSELLLLKIHAHKKPKTAYLARITELESSGLSDRDVLMRIRRRGSNFLRRYGLFLRALPKWVSGCLQSSRAECSSLSIHDGQFEPSEKKKGV